MKFTLTFKTPGVSEEIDEIVDGLEFGDREKIDKVINEYLRYDELITVEFDTETSKARVMNIQEW